MAVSEEQHFSAFCDFESHWHTATILDTLGFESDESRNAVDREPVAESDSNGVVL